ncbi:hypothetical protein F4Z98_03100 [Candidatus Poribacteria bacterium]|nr:hypothetical protein [Candidatus Poribacteria bacterium]MYB01803.1 hypothetical protein [Candidatus Poribacteria bacterium]
MKFESAQHHWYLTLTEHGHLTWMPTHFCIRQAIRDINFLRLGPMPIEKVRDRIAEKLSLTETQKNARDRNSFRIFHMLMNFVVHSLIREKSPMPAYQLIMTNDGLFTSAASEKWFVYYDIFRDVLNISEGTVAIEYVDPGIGRQFKQFGYENSFAARQVTPDDFLPIR